MDRDETDIVKKYKKYPEFKKQMDQIQAFYNASLNLALYQNLDKTQNAKVFETLQVDPKDNLIILFYGFKQTNDLQKLYHLYIRTYDELFRTKVKKYSVIFFNSMCSSNDNFGNFKSMYKTLPIMYYSKLQKVYILHPTLSVKSLDWIVFGRLNKLFSRRLEYVNILEDLSKYKIPSSNIIEKIPESIRAFNNLEKNNILQPKPAENNTTTINKKPEIKSMIYVKPKSPFDALIMPIDKYQMSTQGIPKLLKLLVSVFNYNPSLIEVEGIFRKSGSIEDQEILISQLLKKNEKYLETVTDGVVIAGVIKKIFTNLSQPLFPYSAYDKIMEVSGIKPEDQVQFVKSLLKQLPSLNYRVLLFLCTFIKQRVIKKQAITKMSCHNCAVVFSPCFLRPKTYELSDLMCSGKLVKVLLIIFSKFEQVFGNSAVRMEIFRKSAQKSEQEQFEQKRASTQSPKRTSNEVSKL